TVSQEWLIRFVEHRVGDKRVVRLIRKWLKAGILEDGVVAVSDRGTGQGSVISRRSVMSTIPVPRGSTTTIRSRRLIVRRPIPTTPTSAIAAPITRIASAAIWPSG